MMQTRHLVVAAFAALLSAGSALGQTGPATSLPDNSEIQKILAERIDTYRHGVGIVVGIIEPQGRRVVAYGNFDRDGARKVHGDSLFEIGSITKVFTSLVLADMARRGEVALADPIAKFLPPDLKTPERNGRSIALRDLATHTSGLPRLPTNMAPKDEADPYADYTTQDLYRFLSSYRLPRDIGARHEYSNLGVGLLGHLLAQRVGVDFETLVRSRVSEPLGLMSTHITLSSEIMQRLAPGHDERLAQVPNWAFAALAGAGALRSSVNDLLVFLAANLGYAASPLAGAMSDMLADRVSTGQRDLAIGLAWFILNRDGHEIVTHSGGTAGYRSFIGFDAKTRVGVVVLSNSALGVDDIGFHLLDPSLPLAKLYQPVAVDPALFDNYIGRYQLAPNITITITREGDRLFAQVTGQEKYEIFPLGDREFFLNVVDAQVTFQVDGEGRATELVLHQNGRDMPARKIADVPPERKVITINAAVLERYVGRYRLAPAVVATVTREGNRLFAQLTSQARFELFAETERDFFYKVVDAQITFVQDGENPASSLILHQNGRDIPANRI